MKYCVKNKVEMTQWEIHKLFFLGGFGHAVTTFQRRRRVRPLPPGRESTPGDKMAVWAIRTKQARVVNNLI